MTKMYHFIILGLVLMACNHPEESIVKGSIKNNRINLQPTPPLSSVTSTQYSSSLKTPSSSTTDVKVIPTSTPIPLVKSFQVKVIAGSGTKGSTDGPAFIAQFNELSGLCSDSKTGDIYILEKHKVRKLSPNGVVETISGKDSSGYQDGPVRDALFNNLVSCSVDEQSNIYLVDQFNYRVRKISDDTMVSTVIGAGKPGRDDGEKDQALLNNPWDITLIPNSDEFYVTDDFYLRKFSKGKLTTLNKEQEIDMPPNIDGKIWSVNMGGTLEKEARFGGPLFTALAKDGTLFISDRGLRDIKKVDKGKVFTLTNIFDGVSSKHLVESGSGITIDNSKSKIFVVGTNKVVSLDFTGAPVVITETDEKRPFSELTFGIALGQDGNLYVADVGSHQIKKIIINTSSKE